MGFLSVGSTLVRGHDICMVIVCYSCILDSQQVIGMGHLRKAKGAAPTASEDVPQAEDPPLEFQS